MAKFGPLTVEMLRSVGEFGTLQQISTGFASWLRYCTDVAQRMLTKLCTMFGHLLGWYTIYIHSRGLLPRNGILPGAKFTLRPSLAFSCIVSVIATHSSSVRQPKFAAWDNKRIYGTFASRSRHLYSAGRPSCWASAHIVVYVVYYNVVAVVLCAVQMTLRHCRTWR